jgi:hypothetical protein
MKYFAPLILALLCLAEPAFAADPQLTRVMPRGGTRGTELELTFVGQRLDDAQEILFYEPGITVKEVKPNGANSCRAKVAVDPDARIGEYRFRVRTESGISPLRTFFVGNLPVVEEKEPNNDPSKPQKLDLNVTVTGVMENEGADCFAVEAKKGQRISAEVEGMRLGTAMFDPFLTVLDDAGAEVATCDDSALFLQDPFVSFLAPKDGRYVIKLRESSYGGSGDTYYRLHVGTFPRPTAVYPAGGEVGRELSVKFLGDPTGPFTQTVKLAAEPDKHFRVFPEQDGRTAPSGNVFRTSEFPNVLEAEPNDTFDKATSSSGVSVPLAFNGIIEKAGDVDVFLFKAAKGQELEIRCYARRLRSPLDPVVRVLNPKGNGISANDDSGGPDSYLRLAVPEDGEYGVAVNDQLHSGGPDYVYRVEVTPAVPKVTLAVPFFDQVNVSQERQTIVVPKGNRFATLVRATRSDFGGAVTLGASNLPDGITMTTDGITDGGDVTPVVFEAAGDARLAAKLVELTAKPTNSDAKLESSFAQNIVLVPNGNQPPFYTTTTDRLAVAVAEEAPFKLTLVQPKVPLVQGGSMDLRVKVDRKPGFDGPIRLRMVFDPPGVTASTNSEIGEGKTEGFIPLNAADGAPAKQWKICVLGSAETDGGRVWTSTQLGTLDVAAPMLAMTMNLAAVERGKSAKVVVNVEDKTPFDGKAKVRLVGLPPNVKAEPEELEFTAKDKTVTFNVTAKDRAPVGTHRSLLCVATITRDGEPIVHNLARGGALRVDEPKK